MAIKVNGVVSAGKGARGPAGQSAYSIAVSKGFQGTEEEWLASLKGEDGVIGVDGKSAYQIAVDNGFTGTVTEWLASLKGEDGIIGKDGETGPQGPIGPAGPGLAAGGTTGQVAVKKSATDYDTQWKTLAAADVGALASTGGTLSGNLTITGSLQIGNMKITYNASTKALDFELVT